MMASGSRIDITMSAPQLGKSLMLAQWLLAGAWQDGGRYPHWPSWWCAPTFEQARQGFLRYLVEPARTAGILRSNTESVPLKAELVNGSTIEARSWDRPNGLYGPTVARIAVDEIGLITREARKAMFSRVRETLIHGLGQIRGAGNVQEVGGEAEAMYQSAEGGRPGWTCRTWTWRDRASAAPCGCDVTGLEIEDHAKHHPDCHRGIYLTGLSEEREDLGDSEFRQLYEAEWVDYSALPVYTFDRAIHVDADRASYDPTLPVEISADFNVDPMSWILGQHHGDLAWDYDEIIIPGGATTDEACTEFICRYPDRVTPVVVYGDASGASRKTTSKRSDYDIIRQRFRDYYRSVSFEVPAANPAVVQRINSVNARHRNAAGTVRYWVHPRCKHLIRDRIRVSWRPGTREIDKRDKSLTHASDAADYRLVRLYPVRTRNRTVSRRPTGPYSDPILSETF